MDPQRSIFLRKAYRQYLQRCEVGGLEPAGGYLPYDFEEGIDAYRWSLFGAEMVKDELRELTNILNAWRGQLLRWNAWNGVLDAYGEQDAWILRKEFVEALAHHCLLHPSSVRDTTTFVATNAIHQLKLSLDRSYLDKLEGDPESPNKQRRLKRWEKEKRLAKLVTQWGEGAVLCTTLKAIDDEDYRKATFDYRNRTSHAIAPRLALGDTQVVTRSVEQATQLEQQPDGTHLLVPIPGKMMVSYSYGGIRPLDMEATPLKNLEQYGRSRACYSAFRKLLSSGMSALPKVRAPGAG